MSLPTNVNGSEINSCIHVSIKSLLILRHSTYAHKIDSKA